MGSFHKSKRSDNEQFAVEVRWGIFIKNLTLFETRDLWRYFKQFLVIDWCLFSQLQFKNGITDASFCGTNILKQ